MGIFHGRDMSDGFVDKHPNICVFIVVGILALPLVGFIVAAVWYDSVPITDCRVVDKEYHSSYLTYYKVNGVLVPNHHPERFVIVINGYTKNGSCRQRRVDTYQDKYKETKVGDPWLP